jgi:hypothetical protein
MIFAAFISAPGQVLAASPEYVKEERSLDKLVQIETEKY